MTRTYLPPANPHPETGGSGYHPELWPLLGVKTHKQFKRLVAVRRAEQLILRTHLARVTRDYRAWMESNKHWPLPELDSLSTLRKQDLVRAYVRRCRLPMASTRSWIGDERAMMPLRAADRTPARRQETARQLRAMLKLRERVYTSRRNISDEDMAKVYQIMRLLQVLDIIAARNGVTSCLWAAYRNLLALPKRPVPESVLLELRITRLWF